MQKISVIVPGYNEEAVLPKLFERMCVVASSWGTDYEIICVDDGSRDRTWELLQAQNQKDPRWRCLSFARNFGHQTAVSAGLYHAMGDAAIIIDADLQDPPEEILRMFANTAIPDYLNGCANELLKIPPSASTPPPRRCSTNSAASGTGNNPSTVCKGRPCLQSTPPPDAGARTTPAIAARKW